MAALKETAFDAMCAAAESRMRDSHQTIEATLKHAAAGDPLSAEGSGERLKTAKARRRKQMRSGVADPKISGAEAGLPVVGACNVDGKRLFGLIRRERILRRVSRVCSRRSLLSY